jgi:hypothetical protein
LEKISVIGKAEYTQEQVKLEKLFKESMQREYNSCTEYGKLADFKEPILVGSEAKKAANIKAKTKKNRTGIPAKVRP